jgi:predicted nuclease of predicted toxin-antitoxin system
LRRHEVLADECLVGRLVEGLRQAGQDVLAVRDGCRGAGDRSILETATREGRALVTVDKCFGDLVVRRGLSVPGHVLVRYSQSDVWAVRDRLLAVVAQHGERLHRMYAVVTPARARVRRLDAPRAP